MNKLIKLKLTSCVLQSLDPIPGSRTVTVPLKIVAVLEDAGKVGGGRDSDLF